jgi:hypothetical protein
MSALIAGLANLAAQIRQEHQAATLAIRRGCEHAIAAGRLLIEAKGQVPHGQWLRWLKEHCQISVRSAQTYMQIAHLAPDAQRIAHLPLRRAALELQCRDRDARQAAERDESTREWARKQHREGVMNVAMRAVFDQIDQLRHKPERRADLTATVLELIADQLNWLNWARQVADELIGRSCSMPWKPECRRRAYSRRFLAGSRTDNAQEGRSLLDAIQMKS